MMYELMVSSKRRLIYNKINLLSKIGRLARSCPSMGARHFFLTFGFSPGIGLAFVTDPLTVQSPPMMATAFNAIGRYSISMVDAGTWPPFLCSPS